MRCLRKNIAEQTYLWILSMGGSFIGPRAQEIIPGLLRRTTMLEEQLKMQKVRQEVDYFDGIVMAHFLVLEHDWRWFCSCFSFKHWE
ncbi:unnamed protein product [Camellia sinensis]